jgi:hypothetical protein
MFLMQWSSIEWSRLLRLMLLGAAGFWLPDTLLHAVRRSAFNGRDVAIVTAVAPLTLLATFFLTKRADKTAPRKQVGAPLIAGVWLFGGLFMTVGWSFSGGGFMGPDGARGAVMMILLSVFPVYTFILATYDGAFGALLLVSGIALVVWMLQRSGARSSATR